MFIAKLSFPSSLRLNVKVLDEEKKKMQELATCRANLQAVVDWIDVKNGELDSLDHTRDDMQTLMKQREDLKVA